MVAWWALMEMSRSGGPCREGGRDVTVAQFVVATKTVVRRLAVRVSARRAGAGTDATGTPSCPCPYAARS